MHVADARITYVTVCGAYAFMQLLLNLIAIPQTSLPLGTRQFASQQIVACTAATTAIDCALEHGQAAAGCPDSMLTAEVVQLSCYSITCWSYLL